MANWIKNKEKCYFNKSKNIKIILGTVVFRSILKT